MFGTPRNYVEQTCYDFPRDRRFVVVHISGEKSSQDNTAVSDVSPARDPGWEGPPAVRGRHDQNEPGFQDEGVKRSRVGEGYGRWDPHFLREQLRETCFQKLGIPVRRVVNKDYLRALLQWCSGFCEISGFPEGLVWIKKFFPPLSLRNATINIQLQKNLKFSRF